MIVYIPLEISVRELQGHLLFAAVAADRGHQVFIATPNDIWLYMRLGLLPKGAYLLKNTNVSSTGSEIYSEFLRAGFDLYCQEQEPSILWDSFDKYLFDLNITKDQMVPFNAVFCWGERDTLGYREFFEAKSDLFLNTGSPRADLWSSRYSSLRRQISGKGNPYMLVVSNFGLWMSKRNWTEWMAIAKSNETIKSLHQEDSFLKFLLEDITIALFAINAVRYLASLYPNYRIVLRPHPLDHPDYWKNILGDHPNIEVIDNSSPLGDWIQGASLVIQNGCTSAIETVLRKVPLISIGPERHQGALKIPGRLGLKVETLDFLDDAIRTCLDAQTYEPIQVASESILKNILSTDSGDAALRMIQVMEDRSSFVTATKMSRRGIFALSVVRRMKNSLDAIRIALKRLPDATIRDEPLDKERIRHDVEAMAKVLCLSAPELTFISNSGVLIGPSRSVQRR